MPARGNRTIQLAGERCVQARTRRGLSRERLADESRGGVSVATLKRLESGAPVYLDTARRLAALLDVSLRELLPPEEGAADPATEAAPATIAVMPFELLGGDEDGRFFADGLAEDLITRLGRRWFPVISRGSTFRYRGGARQPLELRADLGADYAIEGSVRRAGDTVRVTARLTDTATARQLWANHYDRRYEDVFALQDALVATIVAQVDSAILDHEVRGLLHKDPADLAAWELSLRGSWCFHRRSKDRNAEARALFEQALRRDPMLPLAWYLLAMTHQRAIINQWSQDLAGSLREMGDVCAEFARHHPNDPGLHIAAAYAAVYAGDRRSAAARLRDAIDLDPNATAAYSLYGQTLAMANEPDKAIEQFEVAIRLSPRDPELWSVQTATALCHFVGERYEEMLRWAELAVQSRPDMPFPHGAVAVARTCLGDADATRAAVSTLLRLEPATTVRGLAVVLRSINPEIATRYLEGLRRAGVPA
jgi:TolB-like protein/Tfp pilus assembly protein PilF